MPRSLSGAIACAWALAMLTTGCEESAPRSAPAVTSGVDAAAPAPDLGQERPADAAPPDAAQPDGTPRSRT